MIVGEKSPRLLHTQAQGATVGHDKEGGEGMPFEINRITPNHTGSSNRLEEIFMRELKLKQPSGNCRRVG